jgi:DNA-binding IscR family transcriptional regulator
LRLARPADSITLLDVVNAVDPLHRITECPLRLKSHARRLCALHQRLDDITATAERALQETTLADVLQNEQGAVPLCDPAGEDLVPLA